MTCVNTVFAACRARAAVHVQYIHPRHQNLHRNQSSFEKSNQISSIMEDEIPDFDLDRFSDEEECSDSDGSTNTISDNSAPVEKSVAIEGIEYH